MKNLLIAAALALATLIPAEATSVLPLFLDEVIDTSTVAFEGTCVANRTELEASTGLVVTYTTFAVHDVLKGDAPATHVIKQIGGKLPEGGMEYRVHGVPSFTTGESYVVFLAGVSKAGFSSPIGLGQGRFSVRSVGDARQVSNGRDFKDLTKRMAARVPVTAKARMESTESAREMDLDEFKQMVRGHVGGAK